MQNGKCPGEAALPARLLQGHGRDARGRRSRPGERRLSSRRTALCAAIVLRLAHLSDRADLSEQAHGPHGAYGAHKAHKPHAVALRTRAYARAEAELTGTHGGGL
jgi:hypothetical protein